MIFGNLFFVTGSLPVKFGLDSSEALHGEVTSVPDVALSPCINSDFGFSIEPAFVLGLLQLGGVGAAGSATFGFDFSRRVIELGGIGTVYRGVEAVAWVAASSKGDRIVRVRSNHGSTWVCPGRDVRPPRRFFVADSS